MSSISKAGASSVFERRLSTPLGGKSAARKLLARVSGATTISIVANAGILAHLILRYAARSGPALYQLPVVAVLIAGGIPLVFTLTKKALHREFGSDLLAGFSIITSILLGEYLVGAIVVLMLSGGTALEEFASRRASSVLDALARRIPQRAHRKAGTSISDVLLDDVAVGDSLVVFPHEICPVDGVVVEGHGKMDEAYLTGEPFEISKTPGSLVLSCAINGESALTIRAEKKAVDSRYATIMRVMQETEQRRPRLRRLGDRLGAWYTPVALLLAVATWTVTRQPHRFLAVLVVATPCPLLIAIPVAVIGAISLSARRGIIVKNPGILEEIDRCRTLIFDKTGTLTYGKPKLSEIKCARDFQHKEVLKLAASLEVYSKHPLAGAILEEARAEGLPTEPATEISERPGQGLQGTVGGRKVLITGRGRIPAKTENLPAVASGLECLVFLDGRFAAAFRFHDAPRMDSSLFVRHLKPRHAVSRVMLVSGDRESEVRYLAGIVGIKEVHSTKSPEEKVEIVREETKREKTLFVGDGINDAPAMQAATVGVAFGVSSDIASEAADAVVMETSMGKVDELIHIGRRMRHIALESAVGGMALSILGMLVAAFGYLPPIAGAVTQEVIDLAAVLNAVRVALPAKVLTDF
ncbi:MAG TPA: heavy metal translocating P-type ATPase [Candidatus Acidoferrales bacterium]|nr:heavy metal translocating P-type ATPase [Candidatus Acidoferrales bacterium]